MEIGFIGCGKIAHYHVQALQNLGAKITSVCGRENSPNIKAFSDKYKISKTYSSWQDILLNEKPDAFWIVASWDQIDSLLIPFIKKGIPCFFEKPVALTSGKLIEAIHLQNEYETKVIVGYNRRFYDFIPYVKEFLLAHKILAAEVHIHESIHKLIQSKDFKKIKYLMLFNSSHVLDLLYYLVGDIEVVSLYKKKDEQLGIPTSYNGILHSSAFDIPIHLIANWGCPANFGLIFYFEDYVIKISPLEQMQIFHGMQVDAPTKERPVRLYTPQLLHKSYVNTQFKPGFYMQAQNFINTCILEKSKNTTGATLADALKITALCERLVHG